MKKLLKVTSLALTLGLAAQVANSAENIAYINTDFLLQNHPLLIDPNSDFLKNLKSEEAKIIEEEKVLLEQEKILSAERNKLQSEDKTLAESLKKKYAVLEKEAPKLRSAEIKKRQDAINNESKAFQNKVSKHHQKEEEFAKKLDAFKVKFDRIQRELTEKRAEIQQKIIPEINSVVSQVAQEKGYSLVLEGITVIYTNKDNANLTEEVYKRLGGKIEHLQSESNSTPAAK